jgi:hypothetical protein
LDTPRYTACMTSTGSPPDEIEEWKQGDNREVADSRHLHRTQKTKHQTYKRKKKKKKKKDDPHHALRFLGGPRMGNGSRCSPQRVRSFRGVNMDVTFLLGPRRDILSRV